MDVSCELYPNEICEYSRDNYRNNYLEYLNAMTDRTKYSQEIYQHMIIRE